MDLAVGGKQVFGMTNLLTREGKPKSRCVRRVCTDLATFPITVNGVAVRDLHGIDFADLQALLDVPLTKEPS